MAATSAFHWMPASVVLLLCLTEVSGTTKTYYDTLRVERTATESQIRQSFRRLAVKYHPDKNKSADAEATFRDIAEAYSVLSDKDKRRRYDSVGHEAFVGNEATVEPEDQTSFHFSFADFFPDFDDTSFAEASHFHWSSLQEEEHVESFDIFEESNFNFYFEETDDSEEQRLY
ncbi:unnamed protein product [Menidia menidia]|uniref:DnaJ homolog subfamily B member 9 n=1 Tax=Menidia menidia TaxID=238744 RepID=A0A8S4BKL1_9TELE|nr:unnamed protein product [Menidia menidia]